MFAFGKTSRARLDTVHPDLQRVVARALDLSPIDFMVLEGVRTPERQRELYGQGRTTAQCTAAGISVKYAKPHLQKVTWTLRSNHFAAADGLGRAVDLVPWPVDWRDLAKFDAIATAMYSAAAELGIGIRWGANWDGDGNWREHGETDSPHFELEPQA
ncbi:M15 family metallopeptidase [Arenimonas alkanexedens]